MSISNSRSRLAEDRWAQTTWAAFAFALLVVVNVEFLWRDLGHSSTIADSPALWAFHRERLADGGKDIALIGTSRMLTGFSTDRFRERFPSHNVRQLAIPEGAPLKILEDLADDPEFRGSVICDLSEAMLLNEVSDKYGHQEHIDFHHHRLSWQTETNVYLDAAVQRFLCCRNPELAIDKVLFYGIERGRLPYPNPWTMQFDRRQLADYQGPSADRSRALTIGKMRRWFRENISEPPDPEHWLMQALHVEPLVRKIQAKGGQVAFVRFPSTDETWQLEEDNFPKREFWDRFARATSAVTIHFHDVPVLAITDCPDTSHIDVRDANRFTEVLLDELVKNEGFPLRP